VFDGLSAEVVASVPVLALLGLCLGSFLNVVVHRLPVMMERGHWTEAALQLTDVSAWQRAFGAARAPRPELAPAYAALEAEIEALAPLGIARPRSRCPLCGHTIRWFENIPVVGWLMLRGRCSACRSGIGWRYPAVELATAAIFALIGWRSGPQWTTLLWCGVAAVLIALALIDWDTTYLPDTLTLPLLWAGLIAAALGWSRLTLSQSLWGAVAGYLSLWSVYWLFKLATGKEGMGYGDFKLLGALGAWFGATMIVPILLLASIVGAAVGIGMKFAGSLREGRYVPFGPFLVGGGLAVMLVGDRPILRALGWA
jgi:leader peptidase (prepilin peptidase) / N-methyltransferase